MKMRKFLALLMVMMFTFSIVGCGSNSGGGEAEKKKELPVAQENTEAPAEAEDHYKSTMKAYDEIKHGNRIVILQNTLVMKREGLLTEAPVTTAITYQGNEVQAYAITYATQFLTKELTGQVAVYNVAGEKVEVAVEDFNGMYAIIDDFQSGNPAALYNPATGTTVAEFAYAITSNGEGVLSVITEQDVNVQELLTAYAWDTTKTYNLVATDLFYIPITPEDYDEGGIRGTLSGSVNASFPEMVIAMGKINDVVFLEQIEE